MPTPPVERKKQRTDARERAEHALSDAQAALRESNERLQLALAAGHLGDWTWDAVSDVVSLGDRAARIFGFPCERLITWAALRELLHEDDRERARAAVETAIAEHRDYEIEHRVRLPSAEYRWVQAYGRARYTAEGMVVGMTGIVQEITGRKEAEEERRHLLEAERVARTAAERMSEMKDRFLATLSHELRTPLSAILGWAQVLRRNAARTEADVARGLEAIERNARLQTKLIEDLLDMSRIASGKVRLDMTTVDPLTFVESAIDTVRPTADAAGIAIEGAFADDVGNVHGDPARLSQVVWNLLSNAIKFSARGGRVVVGARNEGRYVAISVADSGAGIRPEFLAHLFERFSQGDASTTRRHGGLGLGLSIVKNLVELHGGSVHAESEGEGCGSTFTVLLPAVARRGHKVLPAHVPPLLESLGLDTHDLSGLRVLVVDDDSDSRELIGHVLADCAADVVAAGSAVEALEILQKLRPHVLVSDIGMPEVDGIDLMRRIRALAHEHGGDTPGIALTAFAHNEDRRRVLRAGYSEHLAKPVEAAKLVATVAAVVGRERRP
jgi:PAS domain S-box-containing protein